MHRPWCLLGTCTHVQKNLPIAAHRFYIYITVCIYRQSCIERRHSAVWGVYSNKHHINDEIAPMMKFPNKGVSQNIRSARSRAFACAGLRADAVPTFLGCLRSHHHLWDKRHRLVFLYLTVHSTIWIAGIRGVPGGPSWVRVPDNGRFPIVPLSGPQRRNIPPWGYIPFTRGRFLGL